MTALGLTPDQLSGAFPFHFVAGADLRIVQAGPAWVRVAPATCVGARLADVFRLQRPQHPLTPEALQLHVGSLMVLECLEGGLPLRGQFMAAGEGSLIFLGSPLLRDPSELAQFKLSLTDWPPHDPVGDYLFLLQGRDAALENARDLSSHLARQRDELRASVITLETSARARERAERRAEQVLDGTLDAVITIDSVANVTFWNTQAEQVFGWTRAEAVGQSLAHLIIPERLHAAHAEGMGRHLKTGEARLLGRRVEVPARHRTGREFPVELTITAMAGDDAVGFSAFVRDVTIERRNEHLLRSQHDVARILTSAQQLSAAAPAILESVCSQLGWAAGAIWLKDRRSVSRPGQGTGPATLRCLAAWADAALTATPFMAETRTMSMEEGTGLPGATDMEQAATVIDVAQCDHAFPRHALALQAGIRWAVSLPLSVEEESLGTLEFFSLETARPVAEVVEGLVSITRQIGQFILRERSERRLVAERQRLTLALEGGALGTWEFFPASGDGTIDERCLAMLGYQSGEFETTLRHWAMSLHPHDLPVFQVAFDRHLSGEIGAVEVEGRVRHKDGHWVWVLDRGRVIEQDADGKPIRVSGTLLDISARKRAESAQRQNDLRVRAMMDNLLEGLFILDGQQRILQVNRAFARKFGYDSKELPGCSIGDMLPDALSTDGHALAASYQRSMGQVLQRNGRRADGAIFPVELCLYEIETSDGRLVAGHVRDLSPLQEAERLKKQFVASVSHELRTPLTAIRGALGLLSSGAVGVLPPESSEVLDVAERNVGRLSAIIGDILDFERIQSGLFSIAPADIPLSSVVQGALDVVGTLAREADVRIAATPSDLRVRADEARLTQVLVNLLSNAVKFSPAGSEVSLTASRQQDWVEVRVSDRGRGVPEALRSIIFEPFRQAEQSDARRHRGAGLGLAICRAIVQQHGGTIGVTPRPGGGATFWFTMPAAGIATDMKEIL